MSEMIWSRVRERIEGGEDDHTEFKRWQAFPGKVAEAICAFANSEGGLLILGVADSGEVLGVEEDPEEVQERLSNLLHTGLNAPNQAALGRYQLGDKWLHWLDVRRYRGPEPLRHGKRIYVRRGRSSVEPSPAELQELFNLFGFILTEEQIIPGTSPPDLDLEVFESFLRRLGLDPGDEPQLDPLDDLRNRGVVSIQGDEPRLTLYGLLCFGRQPQAFVPTRSAWIQMTAYAGPDRTEEVILSGEAKGRIDGDGGVGRRPRHPQRRGVRGESPPNPSAVCVVTDAIVDTSILVDLLRGFQPAGVWFEGLGQRRVAIMIASVAVRLAVPLYTTNLKHFQPLPAVDAKKPY